MLKIKIYAKNENVCKKLKFMQKIKIYAKNKIYDKNQNLCKKLKFMLKIKIYAKNQNLC